MTILVGGIPQFDLCVQLVDPSDCHVYAVAREMFRRDVGAWEHATPAERRRHAAKVRAVLKALPGNLRLAEMCAP